MAKRELYNIEQQHSISGFVAMLQFIIDHGKEKLEDWSNSTGGDKFAKQWLEGQINQDRPLSDERVGVLSNRTLDFDKLIDGLEAYSGSQLRNFIENGGENFGFTLLPNTIRDYLVKHYGFKIMTRIYQVGVGQKQAYDELMSLNKDALPATGIYGISKSETDAANCLTKKDALTHWVYVANDGSLMTWGSCREDAIALLRAEKYNRVIISMHNR